MPEGKEAPEDKPIPREKDGNMSAQPKLVIATQEEIRALKAPHTDGRKQTWLEGLKMTAQKALTPSVSVSPAVIGLLLTIVIQTVVIVWWAASVSSVTSNNTKEIEKLRSDFDTQKVYLDNTREKFIKMETLLSTMQNESQLKQLLEKEKGK